MSWFADLAGKAENLLNNLDEQTGAALRNHNVSKPKRNDRQDHEPGSNLKKKGNTRKKPPVVETKSNVISTQKSRVYHQTRSQSRESHDSGSPTIRRSPTKKSNHYNLGDINNDDLTNDQFGSKIRRFSLPTDLEIFSNENLTYKMQNLEVENAMLKNELNVMNREVADLLDRLRKTEDELNEIHTQNEKATALNAKTSLEKDTLSAQVELLKNKVGERATDEIVRFKELNQNMETEIVLLRDANADLQDKYEELCHKITEKETAQMRMENELRHAQAIISDLQQNLEKSSAECLRIEKDWEAYKLRVKSMLYAKDNEIKALVEGVNLTEDTKVLVGEIEDLKKEREDLSLSLSKVRTEYEGMKHNITHLESRYSTAERVVSALRDALRDERGARTRAETQCTAVAKELKDLELETGITITNLRTALRDKENEFNNLRETTSSVQTTDTSALNVADYDVTKDSEDIEKIEYLTETLVQRQKKLDSLLAENNVLRIQLDKLESRYKAEVLRSNSHSVVHFHESVRQRHLPDSTLSTFSVRLGVFIKRHPLSRLFIIFYMVCLHVWVFTVLLSNTPEDYFKRPSKS